MSCLLGGKAFDPPQWSYGYSLLSGQAILTSNYNALVIWHTCKVWCLETRRHAVSLSIEELEFDLVLLV